MRLCTISGSARLDSSNQRLLNALPALLPQHEVLDGGIHALPLFLDGQDAHPWPPAVLAWREALRQCDALVISTPAYLHNLPASLKNALEWIASSGELVDKRVLPITLTPHEPRGEHAMQSLCWSLQALNARIVTQLSLYHKDLVYDEAGILQPSEGQELLLAALDVLLDGA